MRRFSVILTCLTLLLNTTVTIPAVSAAESKSADSSSSKPEHLELAIFFAGASTMDDQESNLEFKGTHVGITGYDFYKVTDIRAMLGYHYGDKDLGSQKHRIYMPEVSLNLDTNILALPTIRKAMPSVFNLALLAGAGFGISYLPYNFRTVRDSAGVEIDEDEWKWDHTAWNFHIQAGFVLDKTLGCVFVMYFTNAITGKPRFNLTDMRFGLAYKL